MKNVNPTETKLVEKYLVDYFEFYHIVNADGLARMIISEVTGMPYAKALMKKPYLISEECARIDGICERVVIGEPIQYIFGHAPFRFLDLKVTPDVLIPRPETEMMVDIANYYLREHKVEKPLIADVGTGSGAIAISCATEIHGSEVYATDVSDAALAIAESNAKAYGVEDRISFEKCDALEGFEYFQHGRNLFDCIISNPPYIPTDVYLSLGRTVREFEPKLALDGGEDGLDIFRKILDSGRDLIAENGLFLFELHETCLEAAAAYAYSKGLKNVKIMKDLAGKNRYLAAVG